MYLFEATRMYTPSPFYPVRGRMCTRSHGAGSLGIKTCDFFNHFNPRLSDSAQRRTTVSPIMEINRLWGHSILLGSTKQGEVRNSDNNCHFTENPATENMTCRARKSLGSWMDSSNYVTTRSHDLIRWNAIHDQNLFPTGI